MPGRTRRIIPAAYGLDITVLSLFKHPTVKEMICQAAKLNFCTVHKIRLKFEANLAYVTPYFRLISGPVIASSFGAAEIVADKL